MIWLFLKKILTFLITFYLSAVPSVKQGHVFFMNTRPYLRQGELNSALFIQKRNVEFEIIVSISIHTLLFIMNIWPNIM